jgi:hypothetical protein
VLLLFTTTTHTPPQNKQTNKTKPQHTMVKNKIVAQIHARSMRFSVVCNAALKEGKKKKKHTSVNGKRT